MSDFISSFYLSSLFCFYIVYIFINLEYFIKMKSYFSSDMSVRYFTKMQLFLIYIVYFQLTTIILCPSKKNNCDQTVNGSYVNLVYTRAVGLGEIDNTIHYLHSTWGIPSVLVARTSRDAELNIDYTKFVNGTAKEAQNSVTFKNGVVDEVSVIMITQVVLHQYLILCIWLFINYWVLWNSECFGTHRTLHDDFFFFREVSLNYFWYSYIYIYEYEHNINMFFKKNLSAFVQKRNCSIIIFFRWSVWV